MENPRTDLDVRESIEVEALFQTPAGTPIRWYAGHDMEPLPGEDWADFDQRDSDGDGESNRSEYIAGTNPASHGSVLRPNISLVGSDVARLRWESASGRSYDVLLASRVDAEDWLSLPGCTGILATPPINIEDFALEELQSRSFFRLRVNANFEGTTVD